MSKSKKIAVTAVLTALIILVCFIYTFINSTFLKRKYQITMAVMQCIHRLLMVLISDVIILNSR